MKTYLGLGTDSFALNRRKLMGVAVGLLAVGVSERAFAAATPEQPIGVRSDLFAFLGLKRDTIVVASVFEQSASSRLIAVDQKVDIHIDEQTWSIQPDCSSASTATNALHPLRSYFSSIVRHQRNSQVSAAVLELPIQAFTGSRHALWAEIRLGSERHRVGNPVVGALLRRNPALAQRFHGASPSTDVERFNAQFAERISAVASAAGVRNAAAYGSRIARMALPDVLSLRTDKPIGFNFATQNGRHPLDDADAVSQAFLTGGVESRRTPSNFEFANEFPYFYGIS